MSTSASAKVIWITGASTGIGRELTLQAAAAGHRVFASARSREKLEQLNDNQSENKIVPLPCDVTDRMSLQNAAKKIHAEVGYLDQVIANAGTCEYFDIDEPDWEMMQRVAKVNYFGAVNTAEVALPLLRKAKPNRGHIVGIGSLASVVPFTRAQAYGASKAAVKYFFDSLRVDLAPENIAVTVVQPGFVDTPMTKQNDFPMPFMMNADKAAAIIWRRLEKRPRLIRFPRRLAWLLLSMAHIPGLWLRLSTKQQRSGGNARQRDDKASHRA